VFTSGKGTLGNAGHANALWTFLMPFGRFFGHYVGQLYKVPGELPRDPALAAPLFERVVDEMLRRERFGVLCNALSMCAFVFAAFGQNGEGVRLDGDLLVRVLAEYGIQTTREDLEWFAGAFWAQSMDLKARCGWQPPTADELPARVYEALSLALDRPPAELRSLMADLIAEWHRQAGAAMRLFGYEVGRQSGEPPW
jgi:aldehyde:ferredoxin oxidoreductase